MLESFPADLQLLERAEVVYHTLPGWQTSIAGAKSYYDLPPNAQKFIDFIEGFVGVSVKYIGTGPKREDMIVRKDFDAVKVDRKILLSKVR